jgi:hypothetical protein
VIAGTNGQYAAFNEVAAADSVKADAILAEVTGNGKDVETHPHG